MLDRTLLWANQEYVIGKSNVPIGRETFLQFPVYLLMADSQGVYVMLKSVLQLIPQKGKLIKIAVKRKAGKKCLWYQFPYAKLPLLGE